MGHQVSIRVTFRCLCSIGVSGNRIERCLSYDEKPLLLFQKLKDAKKNPVFMLKHIKDIRSPIAVAQQKHAARKATSTDTTVTHSHSKSPSISRAANQPPRLEVQDLSGSAPSASSLSPQPGWPEPGMVSPAVDNLRGDEVPVGPSSAGTHTPNASGTMLTASTSSGHEALRSRTAEQIEQPPSTSTSGRDIPAASTGVSYAVAIYPYMAEQEDEFDVVV